VFRFVAPQVVQVLSEDRTTAYAMLMTIPAWRPDPPDEHEMTFWQTRADAPPAVATWFLSGQSTGYEFLYPDERWDNAPTGEPIPRAQP